MFLDVSVIANNTSISLIYKGCTLSTFLVISTLVIHGLYRTVVFFVRLLLFCYCFPGSRLVFFASAQAENTVFDAPISNLNSDVRPCQFCSVMFTGNRSVFLLVPAGSNKEVLLVSVLFLLYIAWYYWTGFLSQNRWPFMCQWSCTLCHVYYCNLRHLQSVINAVAHFVICNQVSFHIDSWSTWVALASNHGTKQVLCWTNCKEFSLGLIIIISLTPSQIPTYNGQCMSVYVCVCSRMASAPLRAPFSNYGRAFVHIRSCTS